MSEAPLNLEAVREAIRKGPNEMSIYEWGELADAARRWANLTSPETIDALEAKTIRWFNANAYKGDQGLSLQEAREFVTDLLRSVEEGTQ